jgi:hypothetical protein
VRFALGSLLPLPVPCGVVDCRGGGSHAL